MPGSGGFRADVVFDAGRFQQIGLFGGFGVAALIDAGIERGKKAGEIPASGDFIEEFIGERRADQVGAQGGNEAITNVSGGHGRRSSGQGQGIEIDEGFGLPQKVHA